MINNKTLFKSKTIKIMPELKENLFKGAHFTLKINK